MSGIVKGILLGAGGALGVCSQTDSLNDLPRWVLQPALKGYEGVSVSRHHSQSQSNNNSSNSEELQLLSREIRDLKIASGSSSGKQVIVYGSSGSSGFLVKVVIVGSAGVAVAYYFGYGFNDIMYVTKATLSKTMKKLEEKMGFLGVKLDKTKDELLAMISGVEETVFSSSKDVQTQIDAETEKIRLQIDMLDSKFVQIERGQDDIKATAVSLDERIAFLQREFGKNGVELSRANSGIRLLLSTVSDLPHVKDNRSLLSQVKDFLNVNWLSSKPSTDEEKKSETDNSSSSRFPPTGLAKVL